MRPLEEAFKFNAFFGSLMMEGDFEAKPSVLLMGQYSTGKTTFIKVRARACPGGAARASRARVHQWQMQCGRTMPKGPLGPSPFFWRSSRRA